MSQEKAKNKVRSQKPPKNNKETDEEGTKEKDITETQPKTRSKSTTSTSQEPNQPKIDQAFEAVTETPNTTTAMVATTADIEKVLQKLQAIQEDNITFKNQLTSINKNLQAQIAAVDMKVEALANEVKPNIEENQSQITAIKTNIESIEESLNFQGKEKKDEDEKQKKLNELYDKKTKELEANVADLKEEVKDLKDKILDMERHNRKYNLLINGIKEVPRENIYKVIKTFLIEDAKMPQEQVDSMSFQNAHRLPSRKTGPRPIIVRFLHWTDREAVLSQAYSGVLPKGKFVLTDLPPSMKEERYKLGLEAYKLRTGAKKYKTRIVESGNKLILQVKNSASDPWIAHTDLKETTETTETAE